MITELILASASPRRRQLLEQIGIEPGVLPSFREEKPASKLPEEAVQELSRQKAEDVAEQILLRVPEPDAPVIVLGADTVVSAGGQMLGKPGSHEEAFSMIAALQGRTHEVITGVTLLRISTGEERRTGAEAWSCMSFAEKTEVDVAPMTREEILRYSDSEEPMDKAGAYGIQGRFAAFVRGIRGDYNNVVGLPVHRVYEELKKMEESAAE